MTPAPDVTLAEVAIAIIGTFEGCRLTAYFDTGGVLTIGWGHTGPDVAEGQTISQAQADMLFEQDLSHLLAAVKDLPILEGAALVSFGYNCGMGALQQVIAGHAVPGNFIHDKHGNVLDGLVRRRHLEEVMMALSHQLQRAT